jgi:uracil-DNA glycosylase family 4
MAGFFPASEVSAKTGQRDCRAGIPKCGACGLYKTCKSPKMNPFGTGEIKILFIAEAPGIEEDQTGKPMQGRIGKWLSNFLDNEFDLDISRCSKINAISCYPGNTSKGSFAEYCKPRLLSQVKDMSPSVIIPMGTAAVNGIVGSELGKDLESIAAYAGFAIPSQRYNAWVCPTYHPSFLFKRYKDDYVEDTAAVSVFRNHIAAALPLVKKPVDIYRKEKLEEQVEIIYSAAAAKSRLKDLANKKGLLAFDYETTGLKPDSEKQEIVSCSFCLDGTDTFAFMMDDSLRPMLSRVLLNRDLRKVASNLKFEERWTMAKLGHGVAGWEWDTMIAAHCLDNRPGITSIKMQGYLMLGIVDYSSHIKPFLEARNSNGLNNIRKLDQASLLLYNGMDSLLEYIVAKKQMESFG